VFLAFEPHTVQPTAKTQPKSLSSHKKFKSFSLILPSTSTNFQSSQPEKLIIWKFINICNKKKQLF